MDFSSIWRQCLLPIYIPGTFCNCQSLLGWIFVLRASATKIQLTWVLYALFVYRYSVSIKRNVQPAGQFLVRRKNMIPQHHSKGSSLQEILKSEHIPALPLVSSSCVKSHDTRELLMLQPEVNDIGIDIKLRLCTGSYLRNPWLKVGKDDQHPFCIFMLKHC